MRRLALCALMLAGCASGQAGSGAPDGPPTVAPKERAETLFREEAARIAEEKASGSVNWSRAARHMEEVVQVLPSFSLGWYNLAVAREALGEADAAETAYRRALREDPGLVPAAENLAAVLHASDRTAEAVQVLEQLVERTPAAPDARVALATHKARLQDPEGARVLCEQALTYDPNHLGAYCVLARLATERKAWGRVRLLAAQGFKLNPGAACLHEALGEAAYGEGDIPLAIRAFQKTVELDSNRVTPHARLAEIGMAQKNYRLAATHFEAVGRLELAPAVRSAAWTNLGVARKGQGDFEGAREAYRQALELNGDSAAAHYNLGILALRQFADLEESQTHLKRFLQLSDERSEEVYGLIKEIELRKQMLSEPPAGSDGDDPPLETESEPAS